MELFKNTNYDFLGKKWPFIIASLILTAGGLTSLAIHGGPTYGIDFARAAGCGDDVEIQSRSLRSIRFEPLWGRRLRGEISVQQIAGKNQVLVGTEIADERQS